MDWTHAFTVIGGLRAFMMYISGRTDKRIDALKAKIESTNNKIESSKKELKLEIRDLDKKIER
ncbi:MAG: hypothetical protein KDK76_07830 [Chlamydiia bacterium]|nr:hypothetical protein [Chlamydiia bacterium]